MSETPRFFILSKSVALSRLINKQKLTIDDFLHGDVEPDSDGYIYGRLGINQKTDEDDYGRRYLRCFFKELSVDDDVLTGRQSILDFYGRDLIDFALCVSSPIVAFVCNAQPSSSRANRIQLFDTELKLDAENQGVAIYKVEPQLKSPEEQLPLDDIYIMLNKVVPCPMVSVYGVVKVAVETQGGMKVGLTDPSLGVAHHITCFLASGDRQMLPTRAKVGDVLRLHRISAKIQHGGVLQLFGRLGKGGLSWLLFDGTQDSALTPQSSSRNFTLKESDYETARIMRTWFSINKPRQQRVPDSVADNVQEDASARTTLKEFRPKSYKNLLVQVIGIFEGTKSSKPVILRCWDGTICPASTSRVDHEKEQLVVFSYDDDLSTVPKEYWVDIFIYDEHRDAAMQLKSGQIILLINVHFAFFTPPYYSFMMHGANRGGDFGRGIKETDEFDPEVIELHRRLESVRRPSSP